MNLNVKRAELLRKKRDLTARLKEIKTQQKDVLEQLRAIDRIRNENPHVCSVSCCRRITSPRTGIGRYGTRYKMCDECRERARLRYGQS